MVDISQLNLSNDLLNKCKEKNIKSLSDSEWKTFTALSNGLTVALDSSLGYTSYTIFLVQKLESIKKLKTSRKPRIIAIVENKEACDNLTVELKSFITKDLVVVSLHNEVSLKKSKKKLQNPMDIIVGTAERIGQLINLKLLSIKSVKNVIILNFENIILEKIEQILTSFNETDLNASGNESAKKKVIQVIVTTSSFDKSLKTFMETHSKESYEIIENCIDVSDDSDSAEDSSSSDDSKIKVNGNINKNEEDNSNDDKNDVIEKSSLKVNAENNSYDIDEALMRKIRSFTAMEKYNSTAKLLIGEFGDVELVSRILGIMLKDDDKCHPSSVSKKSKPVYTGNVSKLTGREDYTAYHFVTDKEVNSKGYLFKSLKRLIEEDIVEKIERIQFTKDSMGFVFDLPSEYDDTFQGSWRDGKFDSMQLMEDIPELAPEQNDRRSMGGGNRGRGNDRGGYRSRGNDRGGFRGRGGRGNDRGGIKRSASSLEGSSSSKVIKFD